MERDDPLLAALPFADQEERRILLVADVSAVEAGDLLAAQAGVGAQENPAPNLPVARWRASARSSSVIGLGMWTTTFGRSMHSVGSHSITRIFTAHVNSECRHGDGVAAAVG